MPGLFADAAAAEFADRENNTLLGGKGNDHLVGTAGWITCFAVPVTTRWMAGNDFLEGNEGLDTLNGFTGNDTELGGGNDIVVGDEGDDLLFGDEVTGQVSGNAGNDHLAGGDGPRDWCDGGDGTDSYIGAQQASCETVVSIP